MNRVPNLLRNLLVVIGLAVLTAVSAAPTKAAASVPVEFDLHIVRQAVFEQCPTFGVTLVSTINIHVEQFFDDAGQLTLDRRHVQFEGTLTNATTGATVPYEGNFIRTWDLTRSTVTLIGERRKTQLPGEGVVAIAAGRLFINTATGDVISESGQGDDDYNAAICRLLA